MPFNILLVDDDPIVRQVLGLQLSALGYAVVSVATSDDALAVAAAGRFDAMLIDQRLDGDDGCALLSRLREFDGTRNARAVAISAELDSARSVVLTTAGFDTTLEKPVDITRLDIALATPGAVSALDDAAALSIWGNIETVRTLRGMLLDELPIYRGLLVSAAARRDESALRDALHRMKSSAGFCGATPLMHFIDATTYDALDWDGLLARYDIACTILTPGLRAALAP